MATLLFSHWPVPIEALRALVPAKLELDLWEGTAFVGVVPFAMERVRPSYLPRFAAFDFLETNLRTYVHCAGAPGVYFFSLEAASRLAVAAARQSFGLPYHFAEMRLDVRSNLIEYETQRRSGTRPRHFVRYRIESALGPSRPGSFEHFLIERYYLFVERGGGLFRGQVHHPPYSVHHASIELLEDELIAAAGLPSPTGLPVHAHYSPGVDVEVFALTRVDASSHT